MPKAPKCDVVKKWAPLLRAVRLNERKLGGVAPFREALERAYSEALFNQRAVDGILASLKQALRRRNKSLDRGYDAAISLRNFIKSVLGTRSAELPQYGMKPRGPRYRTGKKPAVGFERPSQR